MMSWLRKTVCVCALTCALGVVAAGSASAAGVLEINKEGVPAAKGATAWAALEIADCVEFYPGEILTNGKAKDKASFSGNHLQECLGPDAPTAGAITQLQASATGAV